MSDEKSTSTGNVVGVVSDLVKAVPVYQDAVQPAARELGKGLETVAKAVNMALAPLSLLVWGYEKIRLFVEERVSEKLRDVPPDRIKPPSPHVAGPALEALKYTGHEESLRELYANLLASSIDSATAASAHPGFVDIIKSMSPDEAKMMRLFASQDTRPVIDVNVHLAEKGGYIPFVRSFSLIGEEAGCQYSDLCPSYLDNLARLGLIEIPTMVHLTDSERYKSLEDHKSIADLKAGLAQTKNSVSCERRVARLTAFGRQFCAVCVIEKRISAPVPAQAASDAAAEQGVAPDERVNARTFGGLSQHRRHLNLGSRPIPSLGGRRLAYGWTTCRKVAALLSLSILGIACLSGHQGVVANPPRSHAASAEDGEANRGARDGGTGEMWLVEKSLPDDPRCVRQVWDVTSSFPWVSDGRVYFVGDPRVEKYSVVITGTRISPTCISCAKGPEAISSFLRKQLEGRFRAAAVLRSLAEFFMIVAIRPTCLLATKEGACHVIRAAGPRRKPRPGGYPRFLRPIAS